MSKGRFFGSARGFFASFMAARGRGGPALPSFERAILTPSSTSRESSSRCSARLSSPEMLGRSPGMPAWPKVTWAAGRPWRRVRQHVPQAAAGTLGLLRRGARQDEHEAVQAVLARDVAAPLALADLEGGPLVQFGDPLRRPPGRPGRADLAEDHRQRRAVALRPRTSSSRRSSMWRWLNHGPGTVPGVACQSRSSSRSTRAWQRHGRISRSGLASPASWPGRGPRRSNAGCSRAAAAGSHTAPARTAFNTRSSGRSATRTTGEPSLTKRRSADSRSPASRRSLDSRTSVASAEPLDQAGVFDARGDADLPVRRQQARARRTAAARRRSATGVWRRLLVDHGSRLLGSRATE